MVNRRTAAMQLQPEVPGRDARRAKRVRHTIDLLSAVLMAAATTATAWSAYQSALWNTDYAGAKSRSMAAMIKVSKFTNLAMQRRSIHVNLFVQWSAAVSRGDTGMADFLFQRFPEPLKAATAGWRATNPLTNPAAPSSPFEMAAYDLAETAEAGRWEELAESESAAAERAADIASRYLRFTIIFASVLFLAGISGKFRWDAMDLTVLVLGALALIIGVAVMLLSPRA
jgi:hypothetical protein